MGTNTVARLITAAGAAAREYHDNYVAGIKGKRVIEFDEVWSFVYAKQKNAPYILGDPRPAGDVWTFSALDADSKLAISYLVGSRTESSAHELMEDLHSRLKKRPQITTDGLQAYIPAVRDAFGRKVDFAQTVKNYTPRGRRIGGDFIQQRRMFGDPDVDRISTSLIERSNLTIRMSNRRFTRKTNAFSKSLAKHILPVHPSIDRVG